MLQPTRSASVRAHVFLFTMLCTAVLFGGCDSSPGAQDTVASPAPDRGSGGLFIIGGGTQPAAMVERMVQEAGVDTTGHAVILPMATSDPMAAIDEVRTRLQDAGAQTVKGIHVPEGTTPSQDDLDTIRSAHLIYLTGGDQRRFMEAVDGTPVIAAIRDSYDNGALVAGTSAGAAVMGPRVITGDEQRYDEYSSTFRTLESDNLILRDGLDLLPNVIVDQHFIYRSRYNRLLTAVLEDPSMAGIGIDESTALLITESEAEVVGEWQIVVVRHPTGTTRTQDNLLGGRGLTIDVYLPGETVELPE
ncbi:MAG: cyanophycinase [Longimonas sp.]|uniref:cyanophycinase n=1 Tax=Longimonas sp. TaxID=2039626 RepID=UPI00334F3445